MRRGVGRGVWGVALLLGTWGVGSGAWAQTTTNRVTIVAVNDSTYQVTGRPVAGLVYFTFTNRTSTVQQANIVAVAPDPGLEQVLRMLRAGQIGRFIANAGGFGALGPGRTMTLSAVLPPGDFAIINRALAPDNRPRFAHGMVAPLRITGTMREPAPRRVDARILTDARFQYWRALYASNGREELLSGVTFNEALRPGPRLLRVENPGGEHEIVIIRTPSVMPQVMSQYVNGRPLSPGAVVVGGVGPLPPQGRLWLHLDMEPGNYWVFCPLMHQRTGVHGFRSGEQQMIVVRRNLPT